MRVVIPCDVDFDPKSHELLLSDDSFDNRNFVELTVEGKTVTIMTRDLYQALLPFMERQRVQNNES